MLSHLMALASAIVVARLSAIRSAQQRDQTAGTLSTWPSTMKIGTWPVPTATKLLLQLTSDTMGPARGLFVTVCVDSDLRGDTLYISVKFGARGWPMVYSDGVVRS